MSITDPNVTDSSLPQSIYLSQSQTVSCAYLLTWHYLSYCVGHPPILCTNQAQQLPARSFLAKVTFNSCKQKTASVPL